MIRAPGSWRPLSRRIPSTKARLSAAAGIAAAIAPLVLYVGVVARHAVNVPRGDDYISILPFLCDWITAPSLVDKLSLLFSQYFSHRIVLTKCTALLEFWMMGRCDLLLLQGLGWLGWCGLATWLVLSISSVRSAPWHAVPFSLLLMQPQGYTNLHTAMQAVQNIGVVVLAFGALRGVTRATTAGFAQALLLAILASFTSVNGLLVFPVAVVTLFIQGRRRPACAFALAGLLIGGAFMIGYNGPKNPFGWWELVSYALAMTGGLADIGRVPLWAVMVAGGAILAAAATCLLTLRTWSVVPSHCAFLLFLMLSIAMAAGGRIGLGAVYMLQDRYRLYGMLAVATIGLAVLELISEKRKWKFTASAAFIATGFCVVSYASHLPTMATAARWCEATAINRQLGTLFLYTCTDGWPEAAASLERAEKMSVYQLPHLLPTTEIELLQTPFESGRSAPLGFTAEVAAPVCGWMVRASGPTSPLLVPDFAAIAIDGRMFVLPRATWRAPFRDVPSLRSFTSRQFSFILPESIYVAGQNSIRGYGRNGDGSLRVLWTGVVDCPSAPASARP